MNKKFIIYIFIILILINILLVFIYFNKNKYIKHLKNKLNDHIALNEELSNRNKKAFNYNGNIISNSLIYDTTGSSYSLSSIIDDKHVIFNFSIRNCSSCYKPIIKLLESYSSNNLIIIYNGNHLRDFKFLCDEHNFNVNIYYSSFSNKSFPSNVENFPCFFILDDNLKIHNTYFPIKNNIANIKDYLKICLNKSSP